jgi:putative flippase GtrA
MKLGLHLAGVQTNWTGSITRTRFVLTGVSPSLVLLFVISNPNTPALPFTHEFLDHLRREEMPHFLDTGHIFGYNAQDPGMKQESNQGWHYPAERTASGNMPAKCNEHVATSRATLVTLPAVFRYLLRTGESPFIQYLRFGTVGAAGVLVDSGVLLLLVQITDVPTVIAKLVAGEVATICNFIGNDCWTFRAAPGSVDRPNLARRFLTYNAISIAGVVAAALLLDIFLHYFRGALLGCNLAAILIISVWNFLLSRRFGWALRKRQNTAY